MYFAPTGRELVATSGAKRNSWKAIPQSIPPRQGRENNLDCGIYAIIGFQMLYTRILTQFKPEVSAS
jgi:hypothetical protein